MMKFHVHVYKLEKKGEVDLTANAKSDAMTEALRMVKARELQCDQEPETEHMAMAFEIDEDEAVDLTPRSSSSVDSE